jgi:hypothetical protein
MDLPDNFVTKILMLSEGDYLVGFYGGGIIKPTKPYKLVDRKPLKTKFNKDKLFSVAQNDFPKLPSKIKPPTAEELRILHYKLQKIHRNSNPPKIVALNDDWRTQGNWIDRYGQHSAVLCAQAGGGLDFFDGLFLDEMQWYVTIGRNFKQKNDQIRRWVHWVESNDKRVLQCLSLGGRKQAEWDDHKEVYPITLDGPHIYCTFNLPAGNYLMSLYFFNKDGHNDKNRLRDYLTSVQIHPQLNNKSEIESFFLKSQSGLSSRVSMFWGGVYKRFFVTINKNECITIKIDSNYSFNTILSGVFFDSAGELKPVFPFDSPNPLPRKPTQWEEVMISPTDDVWWSTNALDSLLCLRDRYPTWFYGNSRKNLLSLVRALVKIENNKPLPNLTIDDEDKELIRSDVAKLLNYVQFFDHADKINYTDTKFSTYWWNGRTKLGRKQFQNFDWIDNDVKLFMENGKQQQSW